MVVCTRHGRTGCRDSACRTEANRRRTESAATGRPATDELNDPFSVTNQALYGTGGYGDGAYGGESAAPAEPARCDPPPAAESYSPPADTTSYSDSGSPAGCD